ncbi:hypothetical protein CERZMDRAFT_40973 [Cercospora zeae-maydis SCOH1-5]|uniref:Methyltransferase domain-containing protein n=1 Tax=Cercospora zeae-maydis SCOH1-5 TaxID=717836 RepID=A0A6A6FGR9_9PEZI|nr:hypothetical protein CERZMDRAFT_40973 [Cercospora zeae-maydis SCOH1-5]
MPPTQQTQNKYVPGHKPTHIQNHTWRTAENSCAFLLPTLQQKVKENPQLKVLDCGAGPGTISASLAQYFPQGHIIATDLSADVVSQAKAHAEKVGASNMSTQVASIFELPFSDNEFDLVHAQQILCHLSEPLPAVKEMLRVCKPGGVVALREGDMRMWSFYPETPELKELHKAILATFETSGGSIDMGPRLVSVALQAGVQRDYIKASMGTWCYSTREERQMWMSSFAYRLREGGMRSVILDKGLGWTAEQLDTIADGCEKWIDAEDGCFGLMHGELVITKA